MITFSDVFYLISFVVEEVLRAIFYMVIVIIGLFLAPIVAIILLISFLILCLLDTNKTADPY